MVIVMYRYQVRSPEFWKKCGPKTLEVSASISLVLFITLNTELASLRSQTNDLHRFRNELMDKETQEIRDAETEEKATKVKSAVERNLEMWQGSIGKIEQAMESLDKDRRETLQAFEKSVVDFRVDAREKVFPMVPAGLSNDDLVLPDSQQSNREFLR